MVYNKDNVGVILYAFFIHIYILFKEGWQELDHNDVGIAGL